MGMQTGHTYERANIEAHLARSKRAPVAGIELTDPTLMPNIALRKAIEAWNEERRAASASGTASAPRPAPPVRSGHEPATVGRPPPAPPDTSGDALLARMLAEELNLPDAPSQNSHLLRQEQGPAVTCGSCRHHCRAGTNFCRHCGARLPLVCGSCGRSDGLSPGASFCGKCGARCGAGGPAGGAVAVAVGHGTPGALGACALAGTWVPTRVSEWRRCPVPEHNRTNVYKYVIGADGRYWLGRCALPMHLGCVCVCVYVRARVCARARVRACVRACVCMYLCVWRRHKT